MAQESFARLVLGLAFAATPTALADVQGTYNAPLDYSFTITHMPDLDQVRGTLPGSGDVYSAPAAVVNLTAYLANHGPPEIPPGPGYWPSAARYADATAAIADFAVAMETTTGVGTDLRYAAMALREALPYGFVVTAYLSDATWSPTVDDMSHQVFEGAYVIAGIGFYDGTSPDRVGGHLAPVASVERGFNGAIVGLRDPASDDANPNAQSPFTTELYFTADQTVLPTHGSVARSMSRIGGYENGVADHAYVDGYLTVRPVAAAAASPSGQSIVLLRGPGVRGDTPVDPYREYALPPGGTVLDLAWHADLGSVLYVMNFEGTASLRRLDPATGADFPVDPRQPILSSPRAVRVGAGRAVLVLDGADLVWLDLDTNSEIGRATPPVALDRLAYDDCRGEVAGLSVSTGQITWYVLQAPPDVMALPAAVTLSGAAGIVCDTPIDPFDQCDTPTDPMHASFWLASEGADALYHLRYDDTTGAIVLMETVTHPQLVAPTSVGVSDEGHVFATVAGDQLLELRYVPGAGWDVPTDPIIPTAAVGGHVNVARSRTNHGPQHEILAWRAGLRPQSFTPPVFDCDADVNGDGTVSFADILAVITAWDRDDYPPEDANQNGTVDFADLLMVIGAWGDCA